MILVTAIIMVFVSETTMAQVPPTGKYNTTNYPEDRKAIEALGMINDSSVYLNDDFINILAHLSKILKTNTLYF